MSFELGKGHFDRVEIWTVWRQEQEPCAALLQDRLCFATLVAGEVVENDDIARLQCWSELGLDIGVKDRPVHGSVDDPRRGHAITPQAGNKGLCSPMTKGRFGAQSGSDTSTSAQPRHLCGRACFIEKDQPMELLTHQGLAARLPVIARLSYFCALGFLGQKCFF